MIKPHIPFSDFAKVDIRIGEVLTAERLEKSEKLLVLAVNLGDDYGTVEILSGIAQWYSPDELVGNKYLFVANLEPRPLMGKVSNGMLLATDSKDKPSLIHISNDVANGTALI